MVAWARSPVPCSGWSVPAGGELVARADQARYAAKASGRNRYVYVLAS